MSERPRWLTETARATTTRERGEGEAVGADGAVGAVGTPPRRVAGRSLAAQVRSTRDRFEARARRARRRPRLLAAIAAVIAVLVAASIWLVWWSPILTTRQVQVVGLSDPGERQAVLSAAAVRLGVPLIRVDTSTAAARVGAIPTVASVTVTRSWPSTLIVEVHRKVPVVAVKNPQGQLQVVDAQGVPYEAVTVLPAGLAVVNATSTAPDPAGLRAAIEVLAILSPAQRTAVTTVTVTSADLVTFNLGALNVVWGGSADGAKKLAVLNALLRTNPTMIDVSAPDTPVTR